MIDLINKKLDFLLQTVIALMPESMVIEMLGAVTGVDFAGMSLDEARGTARSIRDSNKVAEW